MFCPMWLRSSSSAARGDQDRQAALELADKLNRLPLPLEQVGAYTRATGDTLAVTWHCFDSVSWKTLVRGGPPVRQYGRGHLVAGVWAAVSARARGVRVVAAAGVLCARGDLVPLENTIGQVTCGSCGLQAACVYSLIRPLRTGFRRIRSISRSVMAVRGASRPASGTRWAMPWCGRAEL